jgi:small subunit ribosomal protein S4e
LTLHDGQTLLVDDDAPYDAGDSIVVANEDDEIVAHFEYEEGALVTAIAGAHAGEIGVIDEIQVTPGSSSNNVLVSQDGSNVSASDDGGFETVEEYVVVIDENFTEDDSDESTDESPAESADETTEGDE